MTAITITTVGFGTLNVVLSPAEKIFITFYTGLSAGLFVYSVSNLTAFLLEGEVKQLFRKLRIIRKVETMRDHIILCGLGRNGRETAHELFRQRQPFVVIEREESAIRAFEEENNIELVAFVGDATQDELLERANIRHAKGLIAALPSDAENVYITLTAREINPALKVIARAATEDAMPKLRRAGATHVVNPYFMGGRRMANLLTRPALVEFVELISGEDNSHFELDVIECNLFPALLGKSPDELNIRRQTGVLVLGAQHGEGSITLNPNIQQKISADDRLFIIGTAAQLEAFRRIYAQRS